VEGRKKDERISQRTKILVLVLTTVYIHKQTHNCVWVCVPPLQLLNHLTNSHETDMNIMPLENIIT